MYKSCSKCGKIHDINHKCNVGRIYKKNDIDKLRSTYKWMKKAEEVKKKANYLCEICKDNKRYVYDNLEVHHITKLQNAPGGLLDNYNLLCLCVECHKKCDRNEIDLEYQYRLAKIREDGR